MGGLFVGALRALILSFVFLAMSAYALNATAVFMFVALLCSVVFGTIMASIVKVDQMKDVVIFLPSDSIDAK